MDGSNGTAGKPAETHFDKLGSNEQAALTWKARDNDAKRMRRNEPLIESAVECEALAKDPKVVSEAVAEYDRHMQSYQQGFRGGALSGRGGLPSR